MKLQINDKEGILCRLNKYTEKDSETECWLFQGALSDEKYGVLEIDHTLYVVSRLSLYIHKNFDLNSELFACHVQTCKNKNCWNPDHLYPGTHAENMRDKAETFGGKSHCKNGHELINATIVINSQGHRICAICLRKSQERSRIKHRKVINQKQQLRRKSIKEK